MKKKSKLINKITLILFCVSLYLGFKINEIKHFINLTIISEWLPFENLFNFKDSLVSLNTQYHHLIDHYYTNGSNSCISINDGIVLEVDEDSIKILSDNGTLILYGELENVLSKVDERILKGQIIGEFNNSLTLYFSKDNHEISYEDVMKS